jgi:NTE family protein
VVQEWLGDRTFKDLRIPCALTAVDIKNGREIILKQGRVLEAVLATIALPGIFPPRTYGDHQLVDGGVLDPVPVSAARSLAPMLPVVAIVLTPLARPEMTISQLPLPVPIPGALLHRITNLRLAQAFDIFLKSVDIGNRMMTELRLEVDDPDVIIRPDVSHIGLLDKVDIHEIARLGEQAADEALDELRQAVSWPNRLRRKLFPHGKAR